ncbi:MAG: hypothetical protein GYB68_12755, partial [Chloroflexi bacterium]|nr:hypothetical protein [Chloroflexota bacterium]
LCVIGHNARVGRIEDDADDLGISVIGKGTHLPGGIEIGRGVVIDADVRASDFAEDVRDYDTIMTQITADY